MFKVKKKIQGPKNKSQDENLTQLHKKLRIPRKIYILAFKKRKKQLTNMRNLLQK